MKILLIASPVGIQAYERITRMPNLGLSSLAANIDHYKHEVRILDLTVAGRKPENILIRTLEKYGPDLSGFSAMSFQYAHTLSLIKLTKNFKPEIITVLGGYHATTEHENILASDAMQIVDYLVRREGEVAFPRFVDALEKNGPLDDIPNLCYLKDGKPHYNKTAPLLNLAHNPIPDRSARILKKGFHFLGWPMDVVETSRGCVFDCSFCSMPAMYGRTFRSYDLGRVIADIRDARRHGARAITLMDDNITIDAKRFKNLCEIIVDEGLDDMRFIAQVSIQGLRSQPGLAEAMGKAGFELVLLGIENISDRNLEFVQKSNQFKAEEIEGVIDELHKQNIMVIGSFILGNPDDTAEDLWAQYEAAQALEIDWPMFLAATPFPSTQLRREMLEQGLITNKEDYSKYDLFQVNIRTKHLSTEELNEIREEMGLKVFKNFKRLRTFIRRYPGYMAKLFFDQVFKDPAEVWGYIRGALGR